MIRKDAKYHLIPDPVVAEDSQRLKDRTVSGEISLAETIKPMNQHKRSAFKSPLTPGAEQVSSDDFRTVSPTKPVADDVGPQREPKMARTRDVDNSLLPRIEIADQLWKKPVIREPGWRRVVVISCIFMTLTLICNIVILIWSINKPPGSFGGSRLLFRGDCSQSASIDTWTHVGINILSTVILAGGNYASQLLVAPTRDAIDRAHSQGRSLDIGLPGLKNWSFIELKHRVLLSILLLTTIPVHVVYNSVMFSTTSSIDVWSFLVANDYPMVPHQYSIMASKPLYEQDLATGPLPSLNLISHIVGNSSLLVNMTASECWGTFSANIVHDYSGYLKVSDIPSTNYNGSILVYYGDTSNSQIKEPQPWTVSLWNGLDRDGSVEAEVLYCLGVVNEPACTVELIPTLLVVIIACNLIKAIVLIMILCLPIDPLRTIGDVVASFMESPDMFTRSFGAVSVLDFLLSKPDRSKKGPWKSLARRYFYGASRRRWLSTILFGALIWLIGFTLAEITLVTQSDISLSRQLQDGFGSLQSDFESQLSFNLMSGIIIVNLPQLYLSFIYVFFNALATSILLSKEWISYSFERKGLRVTNPIGEQRSTYFLSLPYRYSVPLVAISIALHWLLSQSLFLVVINQYATDLKTAVLLGVGAVLIIGMMIFAFFKYRPGMPIVQSDSRAISAACHPVCSHDDPTKKVQYGVIARLGPGKYHVGFSSGPVHPLVDGQYYE